MNNVDKIDFDHLSFFSSKIGMFYFIVFNRKTTRIISIPGMQGAIYNYDDKDIAFFSIGLSGINRHIYSGNYFFLACFDGDWDIIVPNLQSAPLRSSIEMFYQAPFDAVCFSEEMLHQFEHKIRQEFIIDSIKLNSAFMGLKHELRHLVSVIGDKSGEIFNSATGFISGKSEIIPASIALDSDIINKCSRLISHTLDYFSLYFEESSVSSESNIALTREIELIVYLFAGPLIQKSLKIENVVDPTLILRVSRYITSAIKTLIQNAIEYSAEGSCIKIYIEYPREGILRRRQFPRYLVIESVSIIIEKKEMDLIFTKGYRGSSLNSANSPDRGLGLWICKNIVENHVNSKITVEQEPKNTKIDGKEFYKTKFLIDIQHLVSDDSLVII